MRDHRGPNFIFRVPLRGKGQKYFGGVLCPAFRIIKVLVTFWKLAGRQANPLPNGALNHLTDFYPVGKKAIPREDVNAAVGYPSRSKAFKHGRHKITHGLCRTLELNAMNKNYRSPLISQRGGRANPGQTDKILIKSPKLAFI
jgi:hypothetical protein